MNVKAGWAGNRWCICQYLGNFRVFILCAALPKGLNWPYMMPSKILCLMKCYWVYQYEKSPKKCRELCDIVNECIQFDGNGIKPIHSSGSRYFQDMELIKTTHVTQPGRGQIVLWYMIKTVKELGRFSLDKWSTSAKPSMPMMKLKPCLALIIKVQLPWVRKHLQSYQLANFHRHAYYNYFSFFVFGCSF